MRRGKMSSGHSRKQFRAGAKNVHRKNYTTHAMRGGIRL